MSATWGKTISPATWPCDWCWESSGEREHGVGKLLLCNHQIERGVRHRQWGRVRVRLGLRGKVKCFSDSMRIDKMGEV